MTSFLPCLGPSRIKPTLKTIQIVPPKPYLAPSLGSQTVYIVISKNWVIIIDLSGLLASPLSARLFRCFCEGYILWANAPQSGEKGQEAVGKGKNGCVQRVLKHHHWRHHRFRGRFSKYDFISSNFICSQNNLGSSGCFAASNSSFQRQKGVGVTHSISRAALLWKFWK